MTNLQIIEKLQSKFGEFYYEFNFKDNEVTHLNLYNKGVETKDLELIGELTSLKHLHLRNNQMTTIQGLDELTKLQTLPLTYNQITTIQGLDKLTSLEMLWLDNNQITEIQGLDGLTNLEYLELSFNNIPEEKIKEFRDKHPKIKVL